MPWELPEDYVPPPPPPPDDGGPPPPPGGGAPPPPPIDWSLFFDYLGLPPDVAAGVSRIFASTPDVNVASMLALAYIRGTQWYRDNFPGIEEGKRFGLIRDERDYRALLNQSNQLYRQFFDRDINLGEFATQLREGVSVDVMGRRFRGEAYIKANRGDLQFLTGAYGEGQLSEAELTALGRQQFGLESERGGILERRVRTAQERIRRVFEGVLATPAMTLGPSGLTSPSLSRTQGLDIGR